MFVCLVVNICPLDYFTYVPEVSRCYWLSEDDMNYTESVADCHDRTYGGGHIAVVVPAVYHSCTDWTLYATLVIFNLS